MIGTCNYCKRKKQELGPEPDGEYCADYRSCVLAHGGTLARLEQQRIKREQEDIADGIQDAAN